MTEFWGTGEVNEEPGWHITVTILGPEDDVLAYCPATSYGIVACAPEEICSTDYTINRFGWITRGTVNVRP
jgi:hypothetical protein